MYKLRFLLLCLVVPLLLNLFVSFSNEPNAIEQEEIAKLEAERLRLEELKTNAATNAEKQKAQEELNSVLNSYEAYYKKYPEFLQNKFLNDPSLSYEQKSRISKAILGTGGCSDKWFSFICRQKEAQAQEELQLNRFNNILETNTKSLNDPTLVNGVINNKFNVELQSYPKFENVLCSSLDSSCRKSIVQVNCGGDSICENNKDTILKMYESARGSMLIESGALSIATQILNVDQNSYGFATLIQNLAGFELNLLSQNPGLQKFFEYGTNEQMCLLKVESFVSSNGLEVEGLSYDVTDEYTGLTSRQKMCDDLQFNVCADLRAERSGVFFNDSISLISHVYVYNSKDYTQLVALNAEFLANSQSEKINVFNISKEFFGESVLILKPGSTLSLSMYIPEIQVFNGELNGADLNGNILLSVYEQKGGNSSKSISESNFEYALDYPILEIGSDPINTSTLINSGVTALDGTSIYDSSILDRVVIN